jgi:hypothetical protein
MELLDRYLDAVRVNLPKDQADDIVAEIADALESQADEREAELHRPLTRDESAELLKAYGHPRVIAARYAKVQYLIGPDLYPFYWYCIKLAVTILVALELAAGLIAALATGESSLFARSLGIAWPSVIYVVGIVTIVFALIERVPARVTLLDRIGITQWNPRTLPPAGAARVPRTTSFFDALANGIAALVLLDFNGLSRPIGVLFVGPVTSNWPFHLTSAWVPFYVTLVVSALALTVTGIITFASPQLIALRRTVMVSANALVIIGAILTLNRGTLVEPPQSSLNALFVWCLCGGIAAAALAVAIYGRLLLRARVAQVSGRPI